MVRGTEQNRTEHWVIVMLIYIQIYGNVGLISAVTIVASTVYLRDLNLTIMSIIYCLFILSIFKKQM